MGLTFKAQMIVKPEVDLFVIKGSDGTQAMLHDRRQVFDASEMNQIGEFQHPRASLERLF